MGLISSYKRRKSFLRLQNDIINYYSVKDKKYPYEFYQAVDYIKANGLSVFPHKFKDKYQADKVELFKDKEKGLDYILYMGKKLYYRKAGRTKKAQEYFNGLLIEQDVESPHRYLTEEFRVNSGDVVIDIGAAEGNFALSVVEQAKELYLFETNKKWIKALEATFAPWKDKVHIVKKFVSNKIDGQNTTIDDLFEKIGKIDFIKIDVEGVEADVMEGCKTLIADQEQIKIAICTYHKQNDEKIFTKQLGGLGFEIEKPDNYMIFHGDPEIEPPYFRKGLIRATR